MEGVEFIENSAFTGFKKLQIVIMASTVKRIGRFAFCGCVKLTQILWSTNLEVIEYSAFICANLSAKYFFHRAVERFMQMSFNIVRIL